MAGAESNHNVAIARARRSKIILIGVPLTFIYLGYKIYAKNKSSPDFVPPERQVNVWKNNPDERYRTLKLMKAIKDNLKPTTN